MRFGYAQFQIAAALAMMASPIRDNPYIHADYDPAPRPKRCRRQVPNDLGPVVDTTRESKRARRRRLAKEQSK